MSDPDYNAIAVNKYITKLLADRKERRTKFWQAKKDGKNPKGPAARYGLKEEEMTKPNLWDFLSESPRDNFFLKNRHSTPNERQALDFPRDTPHEREQITGPMKKATHVKGTSPRPGQSVAADINEAKPLMSQKQFDAMWKARYEADQKEKNRRKTGDRAEDFPKDPYDKTKVHEAEDKLRRASDGELGSKFHEKKKTKAKTEPSKVRDTPPGLAIEKTLYDFLNEGRKKKLKRDYNNPKEVGYVPNRNENLDERILGSNEYEYWKLNKHHHDLAWKRGVGPGTTHTLHKGDVFGIRPAHSKKGMYRIIIPHMGPNFVHSIPETEAQHLAGHSRIAGKYKGDLPEHYRIEATVFPKRDWASNDSSTASRPSNAADAPHLKGKPIKINKKVGQNLYRKLAARATSQQSGMSDSDIRGMYEAAEADGYVFYIVEEPFTLAAAGSLIAGAALSSSAEHGIKHLAKHLHKHISNHIKKHFKGKHPSSADARGLGEDELNELSRTKLSKYLGDNWASRENLARKDSEGTETGRDLRAMHNRNVGKAQATKRLTIPEEEVNEDIRHIRRDIKHKAQNASKLSDDELGHYWDLTKPHPDGFRPYNDPKGTHFGMFHKELIRRERTPGYKYYLGDLKKEEEVNELKKSTLASYIKKAARDSEFNYNGRIIRNRLDGIDRAADKLAEGTLQELSRHTLGSYIRKSSKQAADSTGVAAHFDERRKTKGKQTDAWQAWHANRADRRLRGIDAASRSLEGKGGTKKDAWSSTPGGDRDVSDLRMMKRDRRKTGDRTENFPKDSYDKTKVHEDELNELSWGKKHSYLNRARKQVDRSDPHGRDPEGTGRRVAKRLRGIRMASEETLEEANMVSGHELHPEDQKHVLAAYVHRYTGTHKPAWASEPGHDYKPQFKDDTDWLHNTKFAVKKNGRLHRGVKYAASSPTWPEGK